MNREITDSEKDRAIVINSDKKSNSPRRVSLQIGVNIIEEFDLFNLNPPYQRGDAWNPKQQSDFIQSIYYQRQINPITLVKYGGTKIVVDGKQRLTAIKDFSEGKFKVILEKDGVYFRTTFPEIKREFNNRDKNKDGNIFVEFYSGFSRYMLNADEYDFAQCGWRQQANLYEMLNKGEPLSSEERTFTNYMISKKVYKFIWEEMICIPNRPVYRISPPEMKTNRRDKGIKCAHDIIYLCFGSLFDDSYRKKSITVKNIEKKSLPIAEKYFEDMGITALDPLTAECFNGTFFGNIIDILKEIVGYLEDLADFKPHIKNVFLKNHIMDLLIFFVKNVQDGVINPSYFAKNIENFFILAVGSSLLRFVDPSLRHQSVHENCIQTRIDVMEDIFKGPMKFYDKYFKDFRKNNNISEKDKNKLEKYYDEYLMPEKWDFSFNVDKKNIPLSAEERRASQLCSSNVDKITGSHFSVHNVHLDHTGSKATSSKDKGDVMHHRINTLKGANDSETVKKIFDGDEDEV